MLRKCAEYIMANRLHAVVVVLLSTLIAPFFFVGTVVMALVTLRMGAMEGLLLLVCASLPDVVQFSNDHNILHLLQLSFSTGLIYALALILRHWQSWNITLLCAAFLGITTVIIIHATFADVNIWWRHELTSALQQFSQEFGIVISGNKQKIVTVLSFLATGLLTAKVILTDILQLLFARLLQSMLFNPGGLRKELNCLHVHYAGVIALGACIVAALAHSLIAVDILPVVFLPFFLVGLYLVHSIVEHRKHLVFWLILIYALLLLCFLYIACALVLLGLLDSCYDLRQRMRLKN